MKKQLNDPMPTMNPLRPPYSEEAAEQRLISLAYDRAEEQLRNGTASSQIISQLLKAGSTNAKLEKKILEVQHENIVAKTEAIKAMQRNDELFKDALTAMKTYSGKTDEEHVEKF